MSKPDRGLSREHHPTEIDRPCPDCGGQLVYGSRQEWCREPDCDWRAYL